MKDLNTFTANVYAKAEQKKKQTRQTAGVLTVAVLALATAVTAAAMRPQLQRIDAAPGQTQPAGSTLSGTVAAVESYTAPADPTLPAAPGRTQAQAQSQTASGASAAPAAAPTTAAPAANARTTAENRSELQAADSDSMTEIGVTEIALERRTQAYQEGDDPTRVESTRSLSTNALLSEKDIITAAYNALDPATRAAINPGHGFAVNTHDAQTNTDGFEVFFNTQTESITVKLDANLKVRSVTRRANGTAAVSGPYNPNN